METIQQQIQELDLTMVKRKLTDREEGQGWNENLCDEVELEYKRFLTLRVKHPNAEIVPNQAVDKFWHQHILDTKQYAVDCQRVFGSYLHHYPYFGMDDCSDMNDLNKAFEKTKELYADAFGESYDAGAARCRTACKPQKCK